MTIFHRLKKSKQQNTIKGGKKAPPNPNKPTNSNNGVFITGPGLELAKYFSLFKTGGGSLKPKWLRGASLPRPGVPIPGPLGKPTNWR